MLHQLWLDVKGSNLPALDQECDKLVRQFREIHAQVRAGEKWKIKQFTHLRALIQSRMEEIDAYYEDNLNDPLVHFAQKAKLKLKQALHLRLREPQGPVEYIEPPVTLTDSRGPEDSLPKKTADLKKKLYEKPPTLLSARVADSEETKKSSSKKSLTGKKKAQPGQHARTAPSRKEEGGDDVFRIMLTPSEYRMYLERKEKHMSAQGYRKSEIDSALSKISIPAIS